MPRAHICWTKRPLSSQLLFRCIACPRAQLERYDDENAGGATTLGGLKRLALREGGGGSCARPCADFAAALLIFFAHQAIGMPLHYCLAADAQFYTFHPLIACRASLAAPAGGEEMELAACSAPASPRGTACHCTARLLLPAPGSGCAQIAIKRLRGGVSTACFGIAILIECVEDGVAKCDA